MKRARLRELKAKLNNFKYQIETQNQEYGGCAEVPKNAPWPPLVLMLVTTPIR